MAILRDFEEKFFYSKQEWLVYWVTEVDFLNKMVILFKVLFC